MRRSTLLLTLLFVAGAAEAKPGAPTRAEARKAARDALTASAAKVYAAQIALANAEPAARDSAAVEQAKDELMDLQAELGSLPGLDTAFGASDGCGSADDPRNRPFNLGRYGRIYTVCVDARGGGVAFTGFPRRQYAHPLPQQAIQVLVRHDATSRLTVGSTGTTGAYRSGLRDLSAGVGTPDKILPGIVPSLGVSGTADTWSTFVLPPHLPGDLDLTVSVSAAAVSTAAVRKAQVNLAGHLGGLASSGNKPLEALIAEVKALPADLDAHAAADAAAQPAFDTLAALLDQLRVDVTAATPAAELEAATGRLTAAKRAVTASPSSKTEAKTRLTVDRTYIGALRLGVAAIVGGAVDGNYATGPSAHDPAGTEPNVLQSAGNGEADAELVLGYTQYFNRKPETADNLRPAAYFGVGLVATGADAAALDLSALQSFHAGAEIGKELLSIGVGPTLRRVTRLQDGFEVGDAMGPSATSATGSVNGVTEEKWQWGLSVVVFAPGLLKVGGSQAAPASNAPPTAPVSP